jgi:hypothetical protein
MSSSTSSTSHTKKKAQDDNKKKAQDETKKKAQDSTKTKPAAASPPPPDEYAVCVEDGRAHIVGGLEFVNIPESTKGSTFRVGPHGCATLPYEEFPLVEVPSNKHVNNQNGFLALVRTNELPHHNKGGPKWNCFLEKPYPDFPYEKVLLQFWTAKYDDLRHELKSKTVYIVKPSFTLFNNNTLQIGVNNDTQLFVDVFPDYVPYKPAPEERPHQEEDEPVPAKRMRTLHIE